MSGYGRFGTMFSQLSCKLHALTIGFIGGPEGLRALTSPKAIITDRWPWAIQTSIPRVVDYPIPSVTQSS